jgi:hypothetical protein
MQLISLHKELLEKSLELITEMERCYDEIKFYKRQIKVYELSPYYLKDPGLCVMYEKNLEYYQAEYAKLCKQYVEVLADLSKDGFKDEPKTNMQVAENYAA